MKIIVAVTGASGAIYARQTLERLTQAAGIERIALITSRRAQQVMAGEGVTLPDNALIDIFDEEDMSAPPASGSSRWDAMIVVPASMGTVARIASGVSRTLIERAADVMLKERRRLVMAVRETPLSLIHLRNMTALTEAGAIILPASPSFYFKPRTLDDLCMTVTERILTAAGVDISVRAWGETE